MEILRQLGLTGQKDSGPSTVSALGGAGKHGVGRSSGGGRRWPVYMHIVLLIMVVY